jgi:hypothetical protein
MEKADVRYAQLSDKKLKKLRKFEEKLGAIVLAVEPASSLADLTEDQLGRITALEQELGVVLLAYRGDQPDESQGEAVSF